MTKQADENSLNTLDDGSLDEIEITDLEPLPASTRVKPLQLPRLTARQRRLSLVWTAITGTIIVGILLVNVSNAPGLITRTFFSSTPTVPPPLAHFYLQSDPGWGKFTINGKAITHLPVEGKDAPLSLPVGSYQIGWQVPPFPTRSCTMIIQISVPLEGTCPFDSTTIDPFDVHNVPVIFFFATLADLPMTRRTDITAQIQALLKAGTDTETVSSGEYYARAGNPQSTGCQNISDIYLCDTQTDQPLLATLHFSTDVDPSQRNPCGASGICNEWQQDCRLFCPYFPGNVDETSWMVEINIQLQWSYTTPDGQSIATSQPGSFISGYYIHSIGLYLRMTYSAQGWQIHFPSWLPQGLNYVVCQQAISDEDMIQKDKPVDGQHLMAQSMNSVPQHPGRGCLINVAPIDSPIVATPTQPVNINTTAYLLERFGVLLAVGDRAHQIWPYLPVANESELALAKGLLF